MLTIVVILAIWVLLSLPMSIILGHSMKSEPDSAPELVGMDGEVAIFRGGDGSIRRVSLAERSPA